MRVVADDVRLLPAFVRQELETAFLRALGRDHATLVRAQPVRRHGEGLHAAIL
jgi:hypothetical protein